MIKFTCTCKESFRISKENMIDKDSVSCPNCGKTMSDELLTSLVSYAKSQIQADDNFKTIQKNTTYLVGNDDFGKPVYDKHFVIELD